MSRLEYYARPLVAFDATNKQHRKFYYEFVKTRSWGHCPVRFIVPDESGWDLITMIQRQLLEYYVTREFKQLEVPVKGKKKPAKLQGYPHVRKSLGLTNGGFELKIES